MQIVRFLSHIFKGATDYVTISARVNSYYHSHHIEVAHLDEVAEKARQADADGLDAYYGVATRSTDLGQYKRGTRQDLSGLGCIWVDIDVGSEGHAGKSYPPDAEAVCGLLSQLPVEPSMIVATGGGYHAYWLLTQWSNDVPRVEALCSAWQALLREKMTPKGWHLDNTSDATRVLRVPGTRNFKLEDPRPVEALYENSPPRYALESLEDRVREAGHRPKAQRIVPLPTNVEIPEAEQSYDLAELRRVLAAVRRAKASSPNDLDLEKAELLRRVLEGRSLANEDGTRHEPRIRVAWLLAHHLPAGTPWHVALELLRPSLHATPHYETEKDPIEKTREAYESGVRNRAQWEAGLAEQRRQDDALRRQWQEQQAAKRRARKDR